MRDIFKMRNAVWILVLSPAYLYAFDSNIFKELLEPKVRKDYRILPVFGEREMELHIQAILNNKVLIHDKWYKKGDKIGAFYIYQISQNTVTLVDKKSSQKILRINQTKLHTKR